MTIVVRARELTKQFGPIRAVDQLDLTISAGEIYGLLGPNGAGKTTLIRLLTGLLRPTSGSVTVMDHSMPDKGVLGQVGYMTQAGALYEELSLRENITFFAELYGRPSPSQIEQVIELVDLTDRADSPVHTLSGGMKQRTSLACALVHRPRLLLLDEPTVGVDPQLRVTFWRYFRQLASEGVTLIVSSHVMDEAARCDRLGFIRKGELIAEGNERELIAQTGRSTLEEAFLHYAGYGGGRS